MPLETVIGTILSVEFLFGASTALAFRNSTRQIFGGLLGTAGAKAGENDDGK